MGASYTLEVSRRCAPDAPPPLGGILLQREYRPVHYRRAIVCGLWLVRYGEFGQAEPMLAEAAAVAPGPGTRAGALVLLGAIRALSTLVGPRSALVRHLANLVRSRKYD